MNSRYNTLLQEKADLVSEAKAVFAKVEEEGRDLTEEEREDDDRAHARLDAINGELGRLERQREREATVGDAVEITGDLESQAAPKLVTPFSAEGVPWEMGFGAQLMAVAQAQSPGGQIDSRLREIMAATGMSEGVPADGGFLVQTDFSNELLNLVHETGVLLGRTDRTTISGTANGLKINAVAETSRVDGSRWGGVQAYWKPEAGSKTASAPKLRQIELDLKKLIGLYYATDELLQDAAALGGICSQAFSEEFGFKVDDAIIRGTGAGMPLGIVGHAATVSVTKEAGQVAATINATNIEKMYARLMASSMVRAEWYINQNCWPQIFALAHVVGTGGVPMFIPAGGINAPPFGTLLGRPITPIEQCETLGTVGDIIFADLYGGYKVIEKGGIQSASSIHVKFTYDETCFRFVLRIDGQPKRAAVLTPFKGGAASTQSPIITLATRA